MATIIDGKSIAAKIKDELKLEIEKFSTKPKLVVILVGQDPASQVYVRNKKKAAEKLGMESVVLELAENVSEKELLNYIDEFNNDEKTNAILVQMPLPKHIDTNKVIESISPIKDVDGFHPINSGRLFTGKNPYAIPCTPKGIIHLIKEYGIAFEGLNALVIGRSNIVGKPISQLLLNENATVTTAHSRTKNISELTKKADLIVTAIGKPNYLTADMVKDCVIIIDVGINRIDNKLRGDVDFENVSKKASFITPVPGGVGPMTIAMLMKNTVDLYKLQNKI